MMKLEPNYYEERVALNCLAGSVQNAKEIYEAAQGHLVCGLLTKNYANTESCITAMKKYQNVVNNAISIGLGAGDPNQSKMVCEVSETVQPQHVNQIFTGVGFTRALIGQNETVINGLVSPTGKVGYVNVATGPLSSKEKVATVPVVTAIAMLKDMGGSSLKFFPMQGLKHLEEYEYVVRACADNNFSIEPTGGINLDNFENILQIALKAGVKKVLPHVYSSIIDKDSGLTRPEDVKKLFEIVKSNLD